MKKIGIVGCGTIGTEIALAIDRKKINAKSVAIYDLNLLKTKRLLSKLKNTRPKIVKNLHELVKLSDLVVETAGQKAVGEIAKLSLSKGKDIFILSIGGLLKNPWIFDSARKNKCNVYFPSGAVIGIDGIKAARMGNVKSVTLTTTKPISSLRGAPYFKKFSIRSSRFSVPKIIFKGTAKEAIKYFPKNINVAATVSLLGIGAKKTKVKIVAVPDKKINRNVHEIEITGNFGRICSKAENLPSPSNPRTSYLAILSSIALLKEICS